MLGAAIKSIEDHGYILDVGIPNVSGFLNKKNAAAFINECNRGEFVVVCVCVLCFI